MSYKLFNNMTLVLQLQWVYSYLLCMGVLDQTFLIGIYCQLCLWLLVQWAASILLALPCPDSSSPGPPPVRCQQNNHKLTVVRNDIGAAIDHQSWIISWTETDSVFNEETSRASMQTGRWYDLVCRSKQKRSGKCRMHCSVSCVCGRGNHSVWLH